MATSHCSVGLFQLNGCNADAVLARAKALMVSSRTEAARKDAKTDYSFALLQASIDEAIKALKARNESAVGTMARHEVMAHIPSVRDFMQERITSKALRELLDSLTDEEIASLYVARLTSIEIIYITTPEELRDFCKRYPDLDARKIQAFGTYLVISLWDDEHKVERMSWYVGAAPRQTLAQRQKAYTSQFKRMERGEAAPGQRNLFHEGTHDREW